ncbi:MAG: hypothetical protein R2712_16435 [Vicinamibacterales bacterium]
MTGTSVRQSQGGCRAAVRAPQGLEAEEPSGEPSAATSASADAWLGMRASVDGTCRRAPDVLVVVLHEIREGRDDSLAVADEHASCGLQLPQPAIPHEVTSVGT